MCPPRRPPHLVERDDLPRVATAHLEQLAQKGGFVHARHCEHVFLDVGLDQGVADVGTPALLVGNPAGATGETAEVDVLVEREGEGIVHFLERPMGHAKDFVATGEALAQPLLHEQRRRAEQHDMHGHAGASGGIPQSLHDTRPLRHRLDFVENENERDAVCGRVV